MRCATISLLSDISEKWCNKYSHFLVQTAINVISFIKPFRGETQREREGEREREKENARKKEVLK